MELSSLQRNILESHIVDKNRVQKLKEILVEVYGGYDNDELDEEGSQSSTEQ